MLNVLTGIAENADAPPAARVAAAVAVIDRGWGKPDQAHSLEVGPSQAFLDLLNRVSSGQIGSPAKVIEHHE